MSGRGQPSTSRPGPATGEPVAAREHLERASRLLDGGGERGYAATVGGAMKAQAQLRAAVEELVAWAWAAHRLFEQAGDRQEGQNHVVSNHPDPDEVDGRGDHPEP